MPGLYARWGGQLRPITAFAKRNGALVAIPVHTRWNSALLRLNPATSNLTCTPNPVSRNGPRGQELRALLSLSAAIQSWQWVSGNVGGGILVSGSGQSFTLTSATGPGTTDITRTGTIRFTDTVGRAVDVPATFFHYAFA